MESDTKSGVTIARRSHFDNADAELGLEKSKTYRDALPAARAGARTVAVLPTTTAGYNPELVGKSPEEMAEIIARGEAAAAASCDTDKLMRQFPGKSPGQHSHSSGGGGASTKPRRSKITMYDDDGNRIFRSYAEAGRVSFEAHRGLSECAATVGEILQAVGGALYEGVDWEEIATFIGRQRAKVRRDSKELASRRVS